MSDLRVPMLECQECPHDMVSSFAIVEKYQRFWIDLDQHVLFGSGFCESLRQLQEHWSAAVEGSVGLRTLNERINQIEPLVKCAHTAEEEAQWEKDGDPGGAWLLARWQARGGGLANRTQRGSSGVGSARAAGMGARMPTRTGIAIGGTRWQWRAGEALALVYGNTVIEQRCIFHKLQNVGTKCRSELKGKEKRDLRKQMMEQAATVYQAETASEARKRLVQWADLSKRSCSTKSLVWLSNGYAQLLC